MTGPNCRRLTTFAVCLIACAAACSRGNNRPADARVRFAAVTEPPGPPLSFAQREQIDAINRDVQLSEVRRKVGRLRTELRAELLAETPDQAAINRLQAELNDARAAAAIARTEKTRRMSKVLTTEQRAHIRGRIAAKDK